MLHLVYSYTKCSIDISSSRDRTVFVCGREQEFYDMVFIVGPDSAIIEEIQKKAISSGLRCCFIGDGKRDSFLTKEQVATNIFTKINQYTNVVILGHGEAKRIAKGAYGEHEISISSPTHADKTLSIIEGLKALFFADARNVGTKMMLDVFSCQAGALSKSAPANVRMTLHSGQKYCVLGAMIHAKINTLIDCRKLIASIIPSELPYTNFLLQMGSYPETMTYCEDGLAFKSTAPKEPLGQDLQKYLKFYGGEFIKFKDSLQGNASDGHNILGSIAMPKPVLDRYLDRYNEMALIMECRRSGSKRALKYVQEYIAMGVNVNADIMGTTALYAACRGGNPAFCLALLEAGAEVERKVNGKTAFEVAIADGNIECAELIRDFCEKASLPTKDIGGFTRKFLVEKADRGGESPVKSM